MKCVVIALVLLTVAFQVRAAPGGRRPPATCLHNEMQECDMDSGPVCGIDASGISETFENQCMAYVIACQRDTFFVEVKSGEC